MNTSKREHKMQLRKESDNRNIIRNKLSLIQQWHKLTTRGYSATKERLRLFLKMSVQQKATIIDNAIGYPDSIDSKFISYFKNDMR